MYLTCVRAFVKYNKTCYVMLCYVPVSRTFRNCLAFRRRLGDRSEITVARQDNEIVSIRDINLLGRPIRCTDRAGGSIVYYLHRADPFARQPDNMFIIHSKAYQLHQVHLFCLPRVA